MSLEDYHKAGKIAHEALEFGRELIRKDAKIVDVCNEVENRIHKLGGSLAFPVQVSCNEIAAHFCPLSDDETIFSDQLVNLDVGVHVNGFIGDNACCVDLGGSHKDFVKAAEEALKAAAEVLRIGVQVSEIGKEIENAIRNYGLNPIRNLSGHGLSNYNIHDAPQIPNYDNRDDVKLEKGMAIAIEPFATDGLGMVHEKGTPTIFSLTGRKSVRVGFVRDIQKEIESYNGLPFATRRLCSKFSPEKVSFAMKQFQQLGIIHEYPPLVEKNNALVSQAENSFYIDDEVICLTEKKQ
ncbi:type II methionyl aminopeptidase [Candidatus Woesearchaeota archaeon]|nr:type II methionyl aminopeptidase [Candidatus Woesearchaeota archaeon]